METLLQDLRYSIRMLAKKPTFTLVATITLAIGIGANTAIFSLVNAVLIRQLPFEKPEKLVWIWSTRVDRDKAFFSIPDFVDYRDRTETLEGIAAFANWGASLTGTNEPERMQGVRISANTFQMLGVTAALGRMLLPEDDRPGSERVVVLSYGLWERRFGLDRNMIGNKLTLNNDSYTVIGVLPRTFIFPGTEGEAEIAVPLSFTTDPRRTERGSNFLRVIARLKPEAGIKQTEAELAAISNDLKQKYPDTNGKHAAPRVVALQDEMVGSYRSALLMLLAAVGFVLLIACSNLANLLLASASARHKEIAIRTAIGATRIRLIRQLLTESMLLAVAGGALAVLGAWWGIDLLLTLSPSDLPRSGEISLDARVLAFTLGVSLLAGLIFGVTPAIHASKVDLIKELKGASKGSLEAFGRNRTRSILVVSEIAISLVLLIGAGLLVKSFQRLQNVSPGFDADGLLLVRLSLPQARYSKPEEIRTFYEKIASRIEALPGVESVGAANVLPMNGLNVRADYTVVGRPPVSKTDVPAAQNRFVSPGYFHTMKIPIMTGRDFTEMDGSRAQAVVVIDETVAARYWPDQNPLGAHLKIDDGGATPREVEIVGVAANVKNFGLDEEPAATIYAPFYQIPQGAVGFFINRVSLVVRSGSDPLALATTVRREVQSVDKDVPASNPRSMSQFLSVSVAPRRFSLLLLAIFALIALLLATTGIYAVISYSVTQQTHEIGIRMALGARSAEVLRMIVGHGLKLVLIGIGIGLAGAFALTRVISGLLYGVSPTDPTTFAIVSVILLIVALGACFVPARRATKVDPMIALRYE